MIHYDHMIRPVLLLRLPQPREAHISQWLVSGPYEEEGKDDMQLFEIEFPPENNTEKAEWEIVYPENDENYLSVDFLDIFPGEHRVAYLKTTIISPSDQEAKLFVGSDDGIKVWLNGELVHQNKINRGFMADEDFLDIQLQEGENNLLMKITQGEGGWEASAVVTDRMSVPLEGLEYQAK